MTDQAKGLRIYGFGGHARSVADVAIASGVRQLVFADVNARDGENFLGFQVVKAFDNRLPSGWQCFAAAGDNRERQLQVDHIQKLGWPLATIISLTATIGIGATIGAGTFVGHHCHVGPMARIGQSCILNTGCIVEHDCVVGDFTHVSVNATLAGRSQLGCFVFLGTGATVIDDCSVADGTICGAGTVVTRSLAISGTYVGAPARLARPGSR
jgi:UDP-N-acetylbacillosamine N-acetyltransferase